MVLRRLLDARLKIALALGLLFIVAAIGLTLSKAPVAVARVNTAQHSYLGIVRQRLVACQAGEVVPEHTFAVRLHIEAFLGPRVTVEMKAHGHVIARGERGSGWTAGVVTVPVKPLRTTAAGVELCFGLLLNGDEQNVLIGERTTGGLAARVRDGQLPGRVRVEDLHPGGSSWWSLAGSISTRMGLGHGWGGSWSALLAIALMAVLALVCTRLLLRELA
jgi:hypothetical protein